MRVDRNTSIPPDWKNFLHVDQNKDGLFKLLATSIHEFVPPPGKKVISTHGQDVLSSPTRICDLSGLHCTQEEADTRLLLHASHFLIRGFSKMVIYATDTDVVIIAIAVSSLFENCKIWVSFGHGPTLRFIPCHQLAKELGCDASWGLLLMHALTGCDIVSAFYGIGKKTAWAVWRSMPHLYAIFARLSRAPSHVSDTDMDEIQRYVILLYHPTSSCKHVNDARKQLFGFANRHIENIPPTLHTLEQHVKR